MQTDQLSVELMDGETQLSETVLSCSVEVVWTAAESDDNVPVQIDRFVVTESRLILQRRSGNQVSVSLHDCVSSGCTADQLLIEVDDVVQREREEVGAVSDADADEAEQEAAKCMESLRADDCDVHLAGEFSLTVACAGQGQTLFDRLTAGSQACGEPQELLDMIGYPANDSEDGDEEADDRGEDMDQEQDDDMDENHLDENGGGRETEDGYA